MDSPGEVTEHTDRFGMTPELRVAVQGPGVIIQRGE